MAQLISGTTIAGYTAIHAGNLSAHSIATTSYVTTQINNLINGAPGALDTLNELAAALGNNASFSTSVTTSLAGKLSLSGGTMTGQILFQTASLSNGFRWDVNSDAAGITFKNTGDGDNNSYFNFFTEDNGNEYFKFSHNHYANGSKDWIDIKDGVIRTNGDIYVNASQSGTRSAGTNELINGSRVWHAGDFSSTNISNWNTAYGWGNHASAGYLTGITSAQVTNALGYTPYNSTNPNSYITNTNSYYYVNAGAGYGIGFWNTSPDTYGITMGTTSTYGSIYNNSEYYLVLSMRNGGGRGVMFRSDNGIYFQATGGGDIFTRGPIYPGYNNSSAGGQSTYYIYANTDNAGLRTNGSWLVNGNIYWGNQGVWLTDWLNQNVKTNASPSFNELYIDGKYSRFGSSSNWDSGSLNGSNSTITNVHFQGHSDFWIGAGNTRWYTSIASGHHDLLINTMQSGGGNVRGITFTASSGGASVYRLGRWHSGTSSATNYLNLDGRLSVGIADHTYSLPSAMLYVKGSTDGGDVLAVDGVNGRLFTVTDSVLDTIYSVNTIAGLPILEILANNTVKIGKYGANSITISNSRIAINSDTVDTNFPFYVSDRSTSSSRYILANPGMGFNLADNYAQLQLYGPAGAYIDFVTSAVDMAGRIIWASGAFSVTGNMSWGGATLSGAVWNGTAISDSYISSASTWNTAYNKRPTAISFSGSSTKTLTLTQGDGSTLTASFTDTDTNTDAQTLSISGNTLSISGGNSVTLSSSGMSQATADGRYLYYRGINAETDFQRFQDSVGEVRFDQINNYNTLSNPPGGYNYGGVLSMRGDNFGFQLWGSHTGDFFFKTQWSDDQYIGWRRVMDTTNYPYASNMNQYVRTSDSVTFTNVYNYGWFRNYNNNEGLYNQANANHFYSRGGSRWGLTGNGGNIYLEFRSNHESTLRGVVYADTSNQIGFLNNGEGWTFRTNSSNNAFVHGTDLTINADGAGYSNIHMNDGDEGSRTIHCNSNRIGFLNQSSSWGAYLDDGNNWYADGSMRAPIFYDSENTAFYMDPSGGSNIRNLYIGDSGSSWSDPGGWGTQVIFSNGPHTKLVLQARTPGIEAGMYVHTPGSVYIGSYTSHDVNLMRAGSRRMLIADGYIYSDVYMEAAGSMRAPIFYDSNNTSYYADFGSSGTSISMNGGITTHCSRRFCFIKARCI